MASAVNTRSPSADLHVEDGEMRVSQTLSLYIPHVFLNYTAQAIVEVFESQGFGKVRHVDLVPKDCVDGRKPYNAAYIHFERWNDTSVVANFQERVMNPDKRAVLVYDDPWYWIVLENKTRRHAPGERKQRIYVPVLSEEESAFQDMISQAEFLQDIALLEEEADHIVSIDSRYVRAVEEENADLRRELQRLAMMCHQMSMAMPMPMPMAMPMPMPMAAMPMA
jgi:hypothetical protein